MWTNGIESTCPFFPSNQSHSNIPYEPRRDALGYSYLLPLSEWANHIHPCSFDYSAENTPRIHSLSLSTISSGSSLAIIGQGFSSDLSENLVVLNGFLCNVTSATKTQLDCQVSHAPAGTYEVKVIIRSLGIAKVNESNPPIVTYIAHIDGVYPTNGSVSGGTLITVTGSGFHQNFTENQVVVAGQSCDIVFAQPWEIVCRTRASKSGSEIEGSILINNILWENDNFSYVELLTPEIISVEPSIISSAVTTLVTITGHKLFSYDSPSVSFSGRSCSVQEANETVVLCIITRGPPPLEQKPLYPLLYVPNTGYARVSNGITVDVALRISSIYPSIGSMVGGNNITISGRGFHLNPLLNSIELRVNATEDPVMCTPLHVTVTQLICAIESMPSTLNDETTVHAKVHVSINSFHMICNESACDYLFAYNSTPVIHDVKKISLDGDNEQLTSHLNITGTLFDSMVQIWVRTKPCHVVEHFFDNWLLCKLEHDAAGLSEVTVLVEGRGLALKSAMIEHKLKVWHINPSVGSIAGGQRVTIHGRGFSSDISKTAVHLDNLHAVVLESNHTHIVFLTLPYSGNAPQHEFNVSVYVMPPHPYGPYTNIETIQENHRENHRALSAHVIKRKLQIKDIAHFEDRTELLKHRKLQKMKQRKDAMIMIEDEDPRLIVEHLPNVYRFNDSLEITPRLFSITPQSGLFGAVVTLSGEGFGDSWNHLQVLIGRVPCEVMDNDFTNTSLQCRVGHSPSGTHTVELIHKIHGSALHVPSSAGSTTFTSILSFERITPASGSVAGGTLLTIHGHGFPWVGERQMKYLQKFPERQPSVTLCNTPCVVLRSNYSQLICETFKLDTLDSLLALNHRLIETLRGTVFAQGVTLSRAQAAFDGNVETRVTHTSPGCFLGVDLGPNALGWLKEIRFYPTFKQGHVLLGSRFTISADGIEYVEVGRIEQRVQEGWNSIVVTNSTFAARFLRFEGAESCQLNQIQFLGVSLSSSKDGQCGVMIRLSQPIYPGETGLYFDESLYNNHPSINIPLGYYFGAGKEDHIQMRLLFDQGKTTARGVFQMTYFEYTDTGLTYSYRTNSTPVIERIFPNNGTARGGTRVSLIGRNLATTDSKSINYKVKLNGIECTVESVSESIIVCVTGGRTKILPNSVDAFVPDYGFALVRATAFFRYLDRWSALATWPNEEPPVDGDFVVIPEGQAVLLDSSTPVLSVLLVQGSLIFERKDGVSLDAHYILVQGGLLEVGREDEPYYNRATITLHGDRQKTIHLPIVGAKVLAIMDTGMSHSNSNGHDMSNEGHENLKRGVVELHGKPRRRSWTKLGQTAEQGSIEIVLAEPVDFEPGDRLIVTSSDVSFDHAEEVEVVEVLSETSLRIKEPLRYTHEAKILHYPNHSPVDMRPEVGLLSHNILVRGDETSEHQLFGVHTMAAHGGQYRVENVEFKHCGQSFVLGRYCVHYHMANAQSHSYVKNNAIHHSFQRAVTVHGSHHLQVMYNVAFHIRGHTFFVEDGGERFNVIEGNLGVWTLRTPALLKSDTKPATYWTSSALNFWRHNVAAGSTNDGFWFELPGHPGGPSFTTEICPVHGHLGEFYNNTAHSNGVHGLRIYPKWTPLADPCNQDSPPSPQYFYNFTSWHNGQHGIFTKEGGDLHHVHAKLVENESDEFFWLRLIDVVYNQDPHIANLLSVAQVASEGQRIGPNKVSIFAPQNEYFYVSGANFVNYLSRGALAGCAECSKSSDMKQGGYTFRFEKLNFVNTAKRTKWTKPFKQIFWDKDGSLTGIVNGTASPFKLYNLHEPVCVRVLEVLDDAVVCDASSPLRRLQIDGVKPDVLDFKDIAITNVNQNFDVVQFLPKERYGWAFPISEGHKYELEFDSIVDWTSLQLRYSEPDYVQSGEWLHLTFPHIDYRHSYQVTYGDRVVPSYSTGTEITPQDVIGRGAISGNGSWSVILSTNNATFPGNAKYAIRAVPLVCPPEGCPVPIPEPMGNATFWSESKSWPERDGKVPALNEDVEIPAGRYILLDISPPKLGQVRVIGRLDFVQERDITFEADSLLVLGQLNIGTYEKPMSKRARVILHGTRQSPIVIVNNNIDVGNKVLAVFGQVGIFGKPIETTWTKLASTASIGDTAILLEQAVSWQVGDEIVITPTEYDPTQLETRVITSITNGGTRIAFNAALQYRHFAGTINLSEKQIPLAAAVGLLTRSVVLEGNLVGENDKYGGHIYVGAVQGSSNQQAVGSLEMRYVELVNFGKQETHYASLKFVYDPNLYQGTNGWTKIFPRNIIHGCSSRNSLNYAVTSEGARNLILTENVFHRTFRSTVFFDKQTLNATIDKNLVAGTWRSPDDTENWAEPFASFYVQARPFRMSGNVVGGSQDAGFTVIPDVCEGSSRIYGNEAHSTLIGMFIMSHRDNPTISPSSCVSLSDVLVWKSAHIGILTVDQLSNLRLMRVVVSDSHIGLSLNFVRTSKDSRADIVNSFILGSTPASTCDASLICRAVTENDPTGTSNTCGSAIGSQFRRVGLLTAQYLNRAKTCEIDGTLPVCRPPTRPERMCSMPWEKRYGLPSTPMARTFVSNTVFGFFNQSDCGLESRAIAHHPLQIEYSPQIITSGIQWYATHEPARLFLGRSSNTDSRCDRSCDGLHFAMILDDDGSFAGSPRASIVANNPQIALPSLGCSWKRDWESFHCTNLRLVPVTFENRDGDRGSRKLGPIKVVG